MIKFIPFLSSHKLIAVMFWNPVIYGLMLLMIKNGFFFSLYFTSR